MALKSKLGTMFSDASKNAKDIIEKTKDKAVHVVDQNDDGKFDLSDVTVIAGTMGDALKKGSQAVLNTAEEKKRELELKALQPIFSEDLSDVDFLLPKFIRVVERDKKHAESEVCKGSIGHKDVRGGLNIITIYLDSLDTFGLSLYPNESCEFYYVDPIDRDRYIALDDYFSYLKVARINELQKLAQELGAKHFRVTFKEEQTAFAEQKIKLHGKIPAVATVDVSHNVTEKKYSAIEVAAEMEFPGHAPARPQLKYLKNDESILTLVSMRMDETAPLLHHKFMIKMSNSSGIKVNDAAKIDSALKSMKFTGNATVESEAKNEARRYLEYEIDF